MFGGRLTLKACNFVHTDEIWKDHVKMEIASQRKWPEKWGFLAEAYRQLEDSLKKIGDENPADAQPKEATELASKAAEILKLESDREKVRFPRTDSELIGWRLQYKSKISQNILKFAGKKDVIKQLGWPREGL